CAREVLWLRLDYW
nr:immunoglobulin heavy chain junction region [Mus musculus]